MPWSGMNPGFLQGLSGLGSVAQGYGQGQNDALKRALMRVELEAAQLKQQKQQELIKAWTGGMAPLAPMGGQGPQGGGAPGMAPQMPGAGMPPMPQQRPGMGQMTNRPPAQGPRPMGGGMMGQIPPSGTPERAGLRDILKRDESGGRNIPQNIVPPGGGFNPSVGRATGPSSASGLYQITDSTLRDTQAGQGYKRAMDAPPEVQDKVADELLDKRGLAPWAPYNKKLAADTSNYLKSLDLPKGGDQQAQQGANQIANNIPVNMAGKMDPFAMVDMIKQRFPNASPVGQIAMFELLSPMLVDSAKAEWEAHKWSVTQGRIAGEDAETKRHNLATETNAAAAGQRKDETGWTMFTPEGGEPMWVKPGEQPRPVGVGKGTKTGSSARAPDGNALMTDEEAKLAAEQYMAGDRTALQGWGRGAQGDSNRVKIRKSITEIAKAKGLSGKDIAATMAEFEGTKAGERALGTREASLGMALAEAEQFAPLALQASEKVDRTQFPTINSLLIAGERGTGDENVVRLAVAVKSIAAAYSLVLTRGGVPTDAARNQANEILDTSYSKGQLATAIDQMMKEIRAAKASPGQVRGQMREGITGTPQQQAPAQQGTIKLDGDGNPVQ